MDNRTALILGLLILGFFALDRFYLGWESHIFLGQEFLKLTDKMAFWR